MSGGIRAATIPNNVKKMIQNIKDVTGNHTDEEIYATLKECSMDPNETAQKLLHQDTFHEVKRRKDRKKENQTSREVVDSRWRPGPPGRGGRGGRGFSSRQDSGNGRNTSLGMEKGVNQASDKTSSVLSSPQVHEGSGKDKGSSATDVANGPIGSLAGGTKSADASVVVVEGGAKQFEMPSRPRSRSGGAKSSNLMSAAKAQPVKATTFSGVYSSALDPVLIPSSDGWVTAVGTIKRAVGSQRSLVEPSSNVSAEVKLNYGNLIQGTMGGKSQGVGENQGAEVLQSSASSYVISSSSRPSSNYGNRLQSVDSSKVGHAKEWKPKPTTAISAQEPKIAVASEVVDVLGETSALSQPVERVTNSEEDTNIFPQKPESLHVREAQNVIIPNHIHVPDAVRTGLSFGSFDAVVAPNRSAVPEDKELESVSVAHQGNEITGAEQAVSSDEILTPTEEPDYVDHTPTLVQVDNSSSGDVSAPSSSLSELNDSKEIATDHENSSAHTSVTYSFGLVPPVPGNPVGQTEASESLAHDVSRAAGFAAQQVDPSTLYAQFYRSGPDSDGRVSPFPTHAVASKYNGNVTVLSSQTSQSLPEGASALEFTTAAQTPLGTQAAGVMPNSIAVTQQPLPLFRQPTGIHHIPHYPPNFFPYSPYFSQFYVPPPTMHQFLGSNAFLQQAQAGSVYPAPPNAAAALSAVKFPLPQYKPGSNVGSSAHIGVGGGYGLYGASPAGFNPGTTATAGNTTANVDLAAAQFKESLYITGQQTEGSAVWFPGPGRDISNLPTNAFYNLPQGQHVTFCPTPVGQGAYAGIFHPAQGVTAAAVHPLLQQSQGMPGPVDMVGAPAGVYQQPQHTQMNWPNNYS